MLSSLSAKSFAEVTPSFEERTVFVGDLITWILVANFFDPMYSKKTKYDPPQLSNPANADFVTISPSKKQSGASAEYEITASKAGSYLVLLNWVNNQFNFTGQSILSLTVEEPPVTFDDFIHDIVNGSVKIENDQLCITRTDSNTSFGVDINFDPTSNKQFNFSGTVTPADFQNVDIPSGQSVNAAWSTAIGTVGGTPGSTISTYLLQLIERDSSNKLRLNPTSSVGGDYRMQLLCNKDVIFEAPCVEEQDLPFFDPPTNFKMTVGFDEDNNWVVGMSLPDGKQTIWRDSPTNNQFENINKINFILDAPTSTITDFTQLQYRADYTNSYKIYSETLSAIEILNGLRHRTLKDATFYVDPQTNKVVIDAPSAASDNGFKITTGQFTGVQRLLAGYATEFMQPGNSASTSLVGTLNGSKNQTLGTVDTTFSDDNGIIYADLGFNLSPIGATSLQWFVYNGDDQLATGTSITQGPSIQALAFQDVDIQYGCGPWPGENAPNLNGKETLFAGDIFVNIFFSDQPALIKPPGESQAVTGDQVIVKPVGADPSTISSVNRIEWLLNGTGSSSENEGILGVDQHSIQYFTPRLFGTTFGNVNYDIDEKQVQVRDIDEESFSAGISYDINNYSPSVTISYAFDDVEIEEEGDGFQIESQGTFNDVPNTNIGCGYITYSGGDAHLFANFAGNTGNNVQIDSFLNGVHTNTATVPGGTGVSLGIFNSDVELFGTAKYAPDLTSGDCIGFFFGDSATFTATDSTVLVGNEIRVQPSVHSGTINSYSNIDLSVQGDIDRLTILEATDSDAAQAPTITNVSPLTGGSGTQVTITGTNFSTNKLNNCLLIMDEDNNRSVPLDVLAVNETGTELMAELGPVPYDVGSTGTVMVGLGRSTFTTITGVAGVEDETGTWIWEKFPRLNNPDASFGTNFLLVPDIDPNDPNMPPPDPNMPPPDPNECKLFSGGVTNGQLCLTVDCDWPEDAKVKMYGRIRDNSRNKGLDTFSACTVFEGGPFSAFECAQKICDFLQASWLAQANFTINCVATDNGDGTAKITISFPSPCQIDWGNLTICASPSPKTKKTADNKKVGVKVDKDRTSPQDSFSYSGEFTGTLEEFNEADDIEVIICDNDGEVFSETIIISSSDLKGSKYSYKGSKGVAGVSSLSLDFSKGSVSVTVTDDLSGLDAPMSVKIEYGKVIITGAIPSSTFKKPLSVCLQSGVADTLTIDKLKLKENSKKGVSSLSIQGGIAALDTDLDFTTESLTVEWGTTFSEVLNSGLFTSKKTGIFSYRQPKSGGGDISGITIDLNKCSYKLDIKNTSIPLDSTGTVELNLFSDGFESGDTTAWTFE